MIDHHHHRWNTESIANCTSTLEIPHKSCNDPHYSTNLHGGSAAVHGRELDQLHSPGIPLQTTDMTAVKRNRVTAFWKGTPRTNDERPGGSVQAASILSTTSESVHNWLATNQVFHCCPRIWFVECLKMLWPFLSVWEFVNPPPPPPRSSALHLLRDN